MSELLTAAQMRAVEQAAIVAGHASGLDLMERAGRGVVDAVLTWCPVLATTAHRCVVLCGPGNNGGDGFVIARHLAARGWDVGVYLCGAVEKLPPDAAANADRWLETGRIEPLDTAAVTKALAGCDLVVDALFGTGLTRPLEGDLRDLAEGLAQWSGHVVAVDIPSGLCADSGRVLGAVVPADLAVTFHRAKLGHFLAEGPACCGALRIVDIGL